MPKLKIKLVVDAEADLYYSVPSPHFSWFDMIKWRLNRIAGRWFRYPWPPFLGFIHLLDCFEKYNQPVTLCITGNLYLSEGEFIKLEKDNPLFKFGLHGFNHEPLTLRSKEVVDSIIGAGIKAAEGLGIKIESFAAPFELTEDINDPQKVYDVLRKWNIPEVIYAGTDDGLKIKRYFNITNVIKEDGLEKVWISNYIEGTSSNAHVSKIIADIEANKDKDAVYCLVSHDFTYKSTEKLERVIKFIQKEGFESI